MSELENKAKEYADAFYPHEFATEEILFIKSDLRTAYKQGFEDGLNVDRWHYPSKGELPDKDVECLVYTKSGNNFIAMIDSSDNCWCTGEFFSEYLRDDYVLAWKYIVPPKEEVTIKCCENCGHYKNNVCEITKTHPNKPTEWTCLDWREEL